MSVVNVTIAGGKFVWERTWQCEEKPSPTKSPLSRSAWTSRGHVGRVRGCSPSASVSGAPAEVDWKGSPTASEDFRTLCNARPPERAEPPDQCVGLDSRGSVMRARGQAAADRSGVGVRRSRLRRSGVPVGGPRADATRHQECAPSAFAWGAKNGEPMRRAYAENDGLRGNLAPLVNPRGSSPFGLVDIVATSGSGRATGRQLREGAQTDCHRAISGTGGRSRLRIHWRFASWVRPNQLVQRSPEVGVTLRLSLREGRSRSPTRA